MFESGCVTQALLVFCLCQETEDQQKEKRFSSALCSAGFDSLQFQTYDYQVATTSTDKALCRKKHADSIQSLSHTPCSRCPSQCSPHSSQCQNTQPSVLLDKEHCNTDATEKGKTAVKGSFLFMSRRRKYAKIRIKCQTK